MEVAKSKTLYVDQVGLQAVSQNITALLCRIARKKSTEIRSCTVRVGEQRLPIPRTMVVMPTIRWEVAKSKLDIEWVL
jgi:hypothetical protein